METSGGVRQQQGSYCQITNAPEGEHVPTFAFMLCRAADIGMYFD